MVSAKRPLARTWSMVFHILESSVDHRRAMQNLVWMPAHGTAAGTIGRTLKSDGTTITARDWRANRLVDAAAKAAASENRVPERTRLILRQALAAAEHGAALAGATTLAANRHRAEVTTSQGYHTTVVMRDSTGSKVRRTRTGARAGEAPSLQSPSLLPNLPLWQQSLQQMRPRQGPSATQRMAALRDRVRERAMRAESP